MLKKVSNYFKNKILNAKFNDLKKEFKTQIGSSKHSKTVISAGASLTIENNSKELIDKVKNNVLDIVKQTNCDSEKLLNFIKAANTKVYRIHNAANLLARIGYETGFISELRGFEALYLSLITRSGLKFKTEPMFVLEEKKMVKHFLQKNI